MHDDKTENTGADVYVGDAIDSAFEIEGVSGEHCDSHVCLSLDGSFSVLSSAVLNGGFREADHILNMKVGSDNASSGMLVPEDTLREYSMKRWSGTVVGMMTAAAMSSMRCAVTGIEGVSLAVIVTAGLSNPRRAGDAADVPVLQSEIARNGTINTIFVTDVCLTPAAMTESIVVATEAKAAALQDLGVVSPVSGLVATGTGTDSIVIASRRGRAEVRYAGKHVLFGEMLARLVKGALQASLEAPSS